MSANHTHQAKTAAPWFPHDATALAAIAKHRAPQGAEMDRQGESDIDMATRLYLAGERLQLIEPEKLTPAELDHVNEIHREWGWRCAVALIAGVVTGCGLAVLQ